ncbi:hypothetical protein J6P92_07955, partial [bacterium]|nr:hypothetical protein [bacterium]
EAKEGVGIKSLPVGGGKSKDFVYTTSVTKAIDFVMDVNGSKKPNSEVNTSNRDIRSFKIASFNKGDPCVTKYGKGSVYVDGVGCVVNLGTCQGINTCGSDDILNCHVNCWAGAKNACLKKGMTLPEQELLISIYNEKGKYTNLPQTGKFWSSGEYGSGYYSQGKYVDFSGGVGMDQKTTTHGVLCLGN